MDVLILIVVLIVVIIAFVVFVLPVLGFGNMFKDTFKGFTDFFSGIGTGISGAVSGVSGAISGVAAQVGGTVRAGTVSLSNLQIGGTRITDAVAAVGSGGGQALIDLVKRTEAERQAAATFSTPAVSCEELKQRYDHAIDLVDRNRWRLMAIAQGCSWAGGVKTPPPTYTLLTTEQKRLLGGY